MAELSTESWHVAPFAHGADAHSSTSMSQLPLYCGLAALVATVHCAVYSLMELYPLQSPLVYPATHAHEYMLIMFVHAAWLEHGLDAHSSMSTPQSCWPAVFV
jgi:hypothetical protein